MISLLVDQRVGRRALGRRFASRTVALWACLVGLGIVAFSGCSPPPEPTPAELLGVWRTDSPGHANRVFEIGPGIVRFGTGEVSSRLLILERVEPLTAVPSSVQEPRRYRLHFRESDGTLASLDLTLLRGSPSTLRLGDRPQEWVRRGPREHDDA